MTMRVDYPRHPRDAREKQVVSRSAQERRLEELHLTAYPSVVNEDKLEVPFDASLSLPKPLADDSKVEERAIALMTTNQLVARLAEIAEEEKRKKEASSEKQNLSAPDCRVMRHNVAFDRNSTYRLDYCNKDVPGFHAHERTIPDYKKNWNETDKQNIEDALKFPYLTMPESTLKKRSTMYRTNYIPQATRQEYRTLSHKTNLHDLSTSFAYSAYPLDDPNRTVKYDEKISALHEPRCVLWKTYSPRDSFAAKRPPESTKEELERLREIRRGEVVRSVALRSLKKESPLELARKAEKNILLPGMKGMGYRQAPKAGADEYIYLPREHFCHQTVYDY